jgi:hypothetical protein
MILEILVIGISSFVALWVNDHTRFGGAEFEPDAH